MSTAEAWVLGYVLNALWQAPLVAATAWLTTRLLWWTGPRAVHRVWVGALAAQAVLPMCVANVAGVHAALYNMLRQSSGAIGSVSVMTGVARVVQGRAWGATWVHASLIVCALTFTCLLAHLLFGFGRVQLLRRSVVPLPLAGDALSSWHTCKAAFKLGNVLVGESAMVGAPITMGWRQILLVFPPGMSARLTPDETFAVLAHEAAHIQRQDYARNLLYEVLALPVAWHPALWFVRGRLVASREMVCDQMAARLVGDPVHYATSLVRLALRIGRPARVSHAIGIFDAHTLERRIDMLTTEQVKVRTARCVLALAACVVVGTGTCMSALALRVDVHGADIESSKLTGPVRLSGGVAAGQILTRVAPKYPQEAKEAKVQGAVLLKTIIDQKGDVQQLTVISGPEPLRQSAMHAVKQWKYKPYLLNGLPVAVDTVVTVTYSLQQ